MRLYWDERTLAKFTTFVAEAGARILPPTNPYEVLRFRCREGVGVVYTSDRGYVTLVGAARTANEFFFRKKRWVATHAYKAYERPEVVDDLLAQHGPNCFYCGEMLGEDVTVEHLLARAHGGPSIAANLCLTHERCNQAAGSLPLVDKIQLFFTRLPAPLPAPQGDAPCAAPTATSSSASTTAT